MEAASLYQVCNGSRKQLTGSQRPIMATPTCRRLTWKTSLVASSSTVGPGGPLPRGSPVSSSEPPFSCLATHRGKQVGAGHPTIRHLPAVATTPPSLPCDRLSGQAVRPRVARRRIGQRRYALLLPRAATSGGGPSTLHCSRVRGVVGVQTADVHRLPRSQRLPRASTTQVRDAVRPGPPAAMG